MCPLSFVFANKQKAKFAILMAPESPDFFSSGLCRFLNLFLERGGLNHAIKGSPTLLPNGEGITKDIANSFAYPA